MAAANSPQTDVARERRELGREAAIVLDARDALAHGSASVPSSGVGGAQRPVELEPLARAGELARDDVRRVLHDRAGLQRRERAHRVEVLLPGRGRDRARAGGMREHHALGDERGLRVLHDHQPGVEARVGGEERRQAGVGRREQRVGAALGEGGELAEREREVVEHERRAAGRGSCRPRRRRPRRGRRAGCR